MITKILNHLDDIVKIIEVLFYVSTGTVAVLTFLSARKTILQPMKTEVFKNQVEVFTSIMNFLMVKQNLKFAMHLTLMKCLEPIFLSCWMTI